MEAHLAMRSNGESGSDPGYPELLRNPVWFLIKEELKAPMYLYHLVLSFDVKHCSTLMSQQMILY